MHRFYRQHQQAFANFTPFWKSKRYFWSDIRVPSSKTDESKNEFQSSSTLIYYDDWTAVGSVGRGGNFDVKMAQSSHFDNKRMNRCLPVKKKGGHCWSLASKLKGYLSSHGSNFGTLFVPTIQYVE